MAVTLDLQHQKVREPLVAHFDSREIPDESLVAKKSKEDQEFVPPYKKNQRVRLFDYKKPRFSWMRVRNIILDHGQTTPYYRKIIYLLDEDWTAAELSALMASDFQGPAGNTSPPAAQSNEPQSSPQATPASPRQELPSPSIRLDRSFSFTPSPTLTLSPPQPQSESSRPPSSVPGNASPDTSIAKEVPLTAVTHYKKDPMIDIRVLACRVCGCPCGTTAIVTATASEFDDFQKLGVEVTESFYTKARNLQEKNITLNHSVEQV